MPIHLDDLDVVPELAGKRSALIVPCNMCPAVTVAVREGRPFLKLFPDLLRSAPFERHIRALQTRLREKGVKTEVFKSVLPHHWFLCMWTAARRKKLAIAAKRHDAVIVLGCASATETVREAVGSTGCKVIEGMVATGVMNAKLKLQLPCTISFKECRITSRPRTKRKAVRQASDAAPAKRDGGTPGDPTSRLAWEGQRTVV